MPEFASQEYWEARFQKDSRPFDWLIPASALRELAKDWTDKESLPTADILHIGCGTSDSFLLRQLVERPEQVENVDYSSAAVSAASEREEELLAQDADLLEQEDNIGVQSPSLRPESRMRWSCLDLLMPDAVSSLWEHQTPRGRLFDIVLDKSTSDSIACGPNVLVRLPPILSINGWTRGILQSGTTHNAPIHPLNVLAVNLAAVTTPSTGKWIVISYSEDRFPFLPPYVQTASQGSLDEEVIKSGFPHPRQLWRLEAKERINFDPYRDETLAERKRRLAKGVVHRPQVSHWLYVLIRTDAIVTD